MRKRQAKKRPLLPDPRFNDQLVTRFVNMLMWDGKKSVAFSIFYDALEIIKERNQEDEKTPLQLSKAFNVTKGAMTNTLNKLEKLGYIHIRPDWADARKKLVSISQSGVDARDNAMQKIKPLLNKIISNAININERELLAELRKFREKVENSFAEN